MVSLVGCEPEPTYEKCVQRLAAGTPQEQIKKALKVLDAAGRDAFPTLISHFSDTTPAEPTTFPRDIVEIGPDGSIRPYRPTVGEVCFDLLQGQVEGNWPKAYRQYYVLSPDNAQQWLAAHQGMTLEQLRMVAARESLQRAEEDASDVPAMAYIVEFLRENLVRAERGQRE